MSKSSAGPVWGDGTLYTSTEAYKENLQVITDNAQDYDIYMIWYRQINDYTRNTKMYFICQKNVFDF